MLFEEQSTQSISKDTNMNIKLGCFIYNHELWQIRLQLNAVGASYVHYNLAEEDIRSVYMFSCHKNAYD